MSRRSLRATVATRRGPVTWGEASRETLVAHLTVLAMFPDRPVPDVGRRREQSGGGSGRSP